MKSKLKKKSLAKRPLERLTAGRMILARVGVGKFWLSNRDGEGMETSEEKIVQMLKEFWKKEF